MLKEDRSTLCLKGSTTRGGVWMCEACEQAPAAFLCKADAASLCATCDAVIHSANPLARRHHRVPVMPIPYGHQETDHPRSILGVGIDSQGGFLSQESECTIDDQDENEAASWLLFDDDPAKNSKNQNQYGNSNSNTNGFLFNGDEYLDLVEYNSCQETQFSDDHKCNDLLFDDQYMTDAIVTHKIQQRCDTVPRRSYGGSDADSVVPLQYGEAKKHHHHDFQHHKFQLGMEYETSNVSSLDVGVVPESTVTEVSISNARTPKGTIDLFSNPSDQMPTQLTPIDRKARVLRYREKKKTRKFEKTIRYASRKAYAEKRPRIKGRFAKRTNDDVEVEQLFSTTLMTEGGYCIVPSF
ncbi:CCT domain-containing protein [Cynara cardunculus var. scolymus]|uniref:CCT domain-containing protein n=1 Tax=Cynara cardunculus var. scolymus TaxID=59895 RepID=A0A118JUT3_CYNCS|nr:CCT domain-containing protein [Cynara cardunculus var. scolymus]